MAKPLNCISDFIKLTKEGSYVEADEHQVLQFGAVLVPSSGFRAALQDGDCDNLLLESENDYAIMKQLTTIAEFYLTFRNAKAYLDIICAVAQRIPAFEARTDSYVYGMRDIQWVALNLFSYMLDELV